MDYQEIKSETTGKTVLIVGTEMHPRLVAHFQYPKAKKPYGRYWFRTLEQFTRYIDEQIKGAKDLETSRITRQNAKAEAKKNFVNPFKVGDILHGSWGYDQTNCEFYQVVAVKPCSVVVAEIRGATVPGEEGGYSMSCQLRAVKDSFVNKETFTCRVSSNYDGGAVIRVGHAICSITNETAKHYSSWYA